MIKALSILLLLLASASCSMTENGLVFGMPDYEKRDFSSSPNDLEILLRADSYLQAGVSWSQEEAVTCRDSERLSLYCALEAASMDVLGEYIHRKSALQEVRFAIDDKFRDRWSKHRLIDFNNHPDTTFDDVKKVIRIATNVVRKKMEASMKAE